MIIAVQAIIDAEKTKDLQRLSSELQLEYWFLWSFKNQKHQRYNVKYIDRIYKYFDLEPDDWYYRNRKLWNKKTYSVIWSILRIGRIRKWLSVDDLARMIKWDKRQIMRIEHWDSLPSVNSYYISEMLNLYDFTEEERIKIKYWIALLQDLTKIFKKYDDLN